MPKKPFTADQERALWKAVRQHSEHVKAAVKDIPEGDNFDPGGFFREPKTLKAVSKAKKFLMKVPKGAPNSTIVGFASEQANKAMGTMGPRTNRKMPKGKKA